MDVAMSARNWDDDEYGIDKMCPATIMENCTQYVSRMFAS